jgi:hypothetical protein
MSRLIVAESKSVTRCMLFAILIALATAPIWSQSSSGAQKSGSHTAPALTPDQREAQKHFRVAEAAIKDGNLDAALDELKKAVELDGKNSFIWYDLALVQSKKNLDQDALNSLKMAQELGLSQKLKSSVESLRTALTYNLQKRAKMTAEEPASPSIEETLLYLNARVGSAFVIKSMAFVPGKFSVDNERKTLWWSRLRSDVSFGQWEHESSELGICTFGGLAAYSGALVNDLDAEAFTFDQKSGHVTINCKQKGCWQFWGECTGRDLVRDVDRSRQFLLRTDTRPSKAKFIESWPSLTIETNGDLELGAAFQRAIRHLVKLMQALPQNQSLDAKDPFAQ